MDPLSALAVACAVTHFVDFGSKILSKGYEISKSATGTTELYKDIETCTSQFESLTNRLSGSVLTGSDAALAQISQGCQEIAKELLARLEAFKAKKQGKREVFSKAFLSVWSEKKVKEMQDKLERYRKQLDTTIFADLRCVLAFSLLFSLDQERSSITRTSPLNVAL